MKHLAEIHHKKVEDLYKAFGWPLYKKFGHAYDAFKAALQDPDKIFEGLELQDLREPLLQMIERRLTPKAVKVRADVEVTCFDYEGIDSIKAALKAGEAVSTDEEFPINVRRKAHLSTDFLTLPRSNWLPLRFMFCTLHLSIRIEESKLWRRPSPRLRPKSAN